LFDEKVTPEEFSTVFFEHACVKEVEVDVEMNDVGEDALAIKTEEYRQTMTKWTNSKKLDMELSQFFISSVISKCFQEDKFWPVDVILFLMSRSLLRSNYSDKGIVTSLLERKEWALVPIVLEKVHDIPERDLVTLIKALVALHDEKDWKEGRFSAYLKMVVNAPRNDIFLQQSLKRISATELPIILETIISWLKDKSSNLNKRSNVSILFIIQLFPSIHTYFLDCRFC
jgi:hypothetical protein